MEAKVVKIQLFSEDSDRDIVTQVIPAHRSQFLFKTFRQACSWLRQLTEMTRVQKKWPFIGKYTHKKEALCQFSTWHTLIRTHKKIFWTTNRSHVTSLSHWTPKEWRSTLRFFPHLHPCSSVVGAERYGMPRTLRSARFFDLSTTLRLFQSTS